MAKLIVHMSKTCTEIMRGNGHAIGHPAVKPLCRAFNGLGELKLAYPNLSCLKGADRKHKAGELAGVDLPAEPAAALRVIANLQTLDQVASMVMTYEPTEKFSSLPSVSGLSKVTVAKAASGAAAQQPRPAA